jgi:hypothetical protein
MALKQQPDVTEERDRAITIEQMTATTGSTGFPVDVWSDLTTAQRPYFAKKQDSEGMEKFEDGHLSAPLRTTWVGSYRADMDPELVDVPKLRRFRYKSRRYDIVSATMIGLKQTIRYITISRLG